MTAHTLIDDLRPLDEPALPAEDPRVAALQARVAALEAQVAQQAAAQEALLSALHHAPVPMQIYDETGLARWLNEAQRQMLGLADPTLPIGRFNILTDPFTHVHGLRSMFLRAYAGEIVQGEDMTVEVGREGEVWSAAPRTVQVKPTLIPMRDLKGGVRGVLSVSRDIRAERLAQGALERLQRRESLELLAAGVGHDLSNLITAISGNAALLEEELGVAAVEAGLTTDIQDAAGQAAFLARQLLDAAGRIEETFRYTPLAELALPIARAMRVTLPRGIRLDLDDQPAPGGVLGNAGLLRQVVMNLVVNARDAIGAGPGTISLRIREETLGPADLRDLQGAAALLPGDYLALSVSDDGCGIDPAALSRIFEAWFTTKAQGSGIGLSATLGILARHQSGLRVQSAPGRGSTFTLFLPVAPPPQSAATPPLPIDRNKGGVVLVIDETDYVRAMLALYLSRAGLSVIATANGREALAALRSAGAHPSLVMTHIHAAGVAGNELRDLLRGAYPGLPFVFMGTDPRTLADLVEDDPFSCPLRKPFSYEALRSLIDPALLPSRAHAG
jgi:signal transduction histidine kinase/CheY-like chemotaxis protein